jgi:cytochrome c biogenesis protein ResB
MRKTISVNDPLRYGGITMYQTDWSISALQVRKDDEGPFNLAMAPLKISGDNKLYGTFLPVGDVNSPNVKGMYVFLFLIFYFFFFFFCTYFLHKNLENKYCYCSLVSITNIQFLSQICTLL